MYLICGNDCADLLTAKGAHDILGGRKSEDVNRETNRLTEGGGGRINGAESAC